MKVSNTPTPNHTLIEKTKTSQTKEASESQSQGRTERAGAGASRSGANIEISEQAKLMQTASEAVKGSPDVRKDRVSALKKSIQDGTYHVGADKIADRLVDEHLKTSFGKNNL